MPTVVDGANPATTAAISSTLLCVSSPADRSRPGTKPKDTLTGPAAPLKCVSVSELGKPLGGGWADPAARRLPLRRATSLSSERDLSTSTTSTSAAGVSKPSEASRATSSGSKGRIGCMLPSSVRTAPSPPSLAATPRTLWGALLSSPTMLASSGYPSLSA